MKQMCVFFLALLVMVGCTDNRNGESEKQLSASKSYTREQIPDFFKGRIVFQSDSDGDNELYLLERRGIKKLTDNNYQDEYPMWSPDGEWISFQANPKAESDFDIFAIKADGSEIKPLLETSRWEGQANWSNDGKAMVFTMDKARIYILDLEKKDVVKAHSIYGETIVPVWVTDTTILFSIRKWMGWNIAAYDMAEHNTRFLTRDRKSCRARVSHNGDRIVYVSRIISDTGGDIWFMNTDGTDKKRFTMNDNTSEYYPSWSPDDRYIVYSVTDDEQKPNWSLWIAEVETGEAWMIFDTQGQELYAAWAP